MKVLLVEDDRKVQDILSEMLQRKGFTVVVADSGSAALDIAKKEKPDIVVSDIMMPNMDGFQFRRAMLEDDEISAIPLVFYSGKYVDEKSRRLAESLGVAKFIRKPVSNNELYEQIIRVLEEQNKNRSQTFASNNISSPDFKESYQEILQERVLKAYHELETTNRTQIVINNLLHLTLQDLTLPELLDALLEQIISFPWYDLLPKGAIFISDGEELVLMAQRGLHESLLESCSRIPYGRCLCGRSAQCGEIVFADHVDDRHDVLYDGIQPHGHYCVPIKKAGGQVLGVFTLYLRAGTLRRSDVESSLESAAVTAASIIMRKMHEDELNKHYQELHALNQACNTLIYSNETHESLYEHICSLAREYFNLKMVWFGFLEKQGIKKVAASGDCIHYLDSMLIRCDDVEEGKGPACQAVKLCKPVACNDIENDDKFKPWRDWALASGFRSSLAVPLVDVDKQCQGMLNVYSGEKLFFNPKRIELLTAYVNNVVAVLGYKTLISNLEEKVKERTVELETARNLAEAADRAKSSFLANMSHELRTPLNSIIGFADIMQQGISGELNADQQEYTNDIHESGLHLLSLVNDILDLSKIEADMMKLEYSEVNVEELLTRSLFMVRQKALAHGIDVRIEVQPEMPDIAADERRLRQVVVNLLGNALKFTPDGGEVSIIAKVFQENRDTFDNEEDRTGYVMISVIDSGPGIAVEEQSKLFKPFVQLEGGIAKKTEGTGLGLALSKRIVEQHRGHLFFASEPGQGSVFSFTVPVDGATRLCETPAAFLPWPIFLQHVERMMSMVSRFDSSILILKLEYPEKGSDANIFWSDIVVLFNGQMRMHECFSREPVAGHLYFLLVGDRSFDTGSAISRLSAIVGKLGIAPSFNQAVYPDDGATASEIFSKLECKLP